MAETEEAYLKRKPGNPIASYWHTLLVVVLLAANAVRSYLQTVQVNATGIANRPRIYARTILFEWLLLAVVVAGLRLRKAPLQTIFGKRWQSPLDLVRDIAIGSALWFVALVGVGILGGSHGAPPDRGIFFLLPQNSFELALWMVVSVSAGICEEAVFRGYLQRQMSAFTQSTIAGVLLSSAAFGAVHLYQGWGRASVIAASAILYGVVVEWRGTVRPGMFAHALQDGIAPILVRLMRR